MCVRIELKIKQVVTEIDQSHNSYRNYKITCKSGSNTTGHTKAGTRYLGGISIH
jgi:hypothetical protein